LLPLVSPDSKSAASILTARLAALVQNDPQLSDDGDRLSAAWLVDAIGDTGEGGVDAVPLLLAILPYEWPQTFVFVPVVKALGRIGPGAKAALPFLKVSADLSDSSDGDRIDRSVATMLIDGTCRTEEEAFIRMLSHPNWRARRSAAQELGRCRELSNVGEQALVAALEDSDEYVRETAAESLLDNGLEREACHRALLHPVPSNGRASMWAPVQIMWRYDLDPAEAIPSLEEELKTSPYPDGIRDMISRIRRNDPFDNASPKRNGGLR
jgi:HEAT repeat protein